jgi:hypothetical protein
MPMHCSANVGPEGDEAQVDADVRAAAPDLKLAAE